MEFRWMARGVRPVGFDGAYFWMQQDEPPEHGDPFGGMELEPEVVYLFGHPDDGDSVAVNSSMFPLTHRRFDYAKFSGPIPEPKETTDA